MKTLIIVILCLLVVLVLLYTYFGGFKKITVEIINKGGETVVYEDITGDYKQCGVVMDSIYYSLLDNYGIETSKGFGKYFDNPQKVEKEKLRSQAGSIIEKQDISRLNSIKGDFKIMELPIQKYLTTEFPYKNRLSVILSIIKVYPALNRFVKANDFEEDTPVIEIYDIPNNKILYRKEIKYLND
jgi:ribosomal protein S24E